METGQKNAGTVLEFKTDFGNVELMELEAGACRNDGSLYGALTAVGDGYPELYGNVTVNLERKIPPYCAFVDTNNMPEAEDFGSHRLRGWCRRAVTAHIPFTGLMWKAKAALSRRHGSI